MKRFISFILAFTMIFGSLASAAPGDIIHIGATSESRKLYKKDTDESQLAEDIIDGANVNSFYRQVDNDKFVNIVKYDQTETDYIVSLMEKHKLDSPEKLSDYMAKNREEIEKALADATRNIEVSFEDIDFPNKGDINDYFEDAAVPSLTSQNYEGPIPGENVGTTMITTKSSPKDASAWIVKVSNEDFKNLEFNKEVEGSKSYTSQGDIDVEVGNYLLFGAVDGGGRLKAYTSIKIEESMVRFAADLDDTIEASFTPSDISSGATKVKISKGHDKGTWKLAALKDSDTSIFKDSEFDNTRDYEEDIELVLASDEELDKSLEGFNKRIIIFKENDKGQIEKYKIYKLGKVDVSSLLDAKKLISNKTNEKDFNYSHPEKGEDAGTTKIKKLNLPSDSSEWMYVLVDNVNIIPKLDRAYKDAKTYEAGQSIKVKDGDNLMLLATKDGKVRAYDIIELGDDMIKDPLAMLLFPDTHYYDIVEGDSIGTSQISLSGSKSLNDLFDVPPIKVNNIQWRYLVSEDDFNIPELNSFIADTNSLTNKSDFEVASQEELLKSDDFNKNLLLLATEGSDENFKIKGYAVIKLNREHVRYPEARKLTDDNYENPKKGPNHGTTKIDRLSPTGIEGHSKWMVKIVAGDSPIIQHNDLILTSKGFNPYNQGSSISNANIENHLVLVSVNSNSRALAYKSFLLDKDSVTAPGASNLSPISHFEGPEPGSIAHSTRFSKLYSDSDSTNWFVKLGDRSLGLIESGIKLEDSKDGFTKYTVNKDIENVKQGQWILLVRTNKTNEVNGYVNIRLNTNDIRNDDAQVLTSENYKISKGDAPGNTKIHDLNPGGIEGPNVNRLKWMYKVIDDKLSGENLPYLNEKVNDAENLPNNGNIDVGNNSKGYILLLATDNSEQTKAYIQIKIKDEDVAESAKDLNIDIEPGERIDRIKFTGDSLEESYMYKLDTKEIPSPGLNEVLYNAKKYTVAGNLGITVEAGKYLTIYKVDPENKIQSYKSFLIKDTDIKKGEVQLENKEILQGDIINGGKFISFKLTGLDEWNDNIKSNPEIRNKIYDGLSANKENTQWLKVINTLKSGGPGNIFVDDKKIKIRLPNTKDYNISENQEIKLVIPPEAVKGAIRPIISSGSVIIRPTINVSLSGTVISDAIRESDIKKGGATIEIKLKESYWSQDVANILSQSYAVDTKGEKISNANWDKIKTKVSETPNSVIVKDEKTIEITLAPVSDVDYASNMEIITLVIDGKFIEGAKNDDKIVATPTFTIYPDILKVDTELVDEDNIVSMQAPKNQIPLEGKDTWKIKLTNAHLKEKIKNTDINIIGMPPGLKYELTRDSDTQLSIQLTGRASSPLVDGNIGLIVKGSAVGELNSIDSDELTLNYIKGTPMAFDSIKYKIENNGIYISTDSDFKNIEYSLNSKNGIGGQWHTLNSSNHRVSESIGPVTIYIREKKQPEVSHELIDLSHSTAPIVDVIKYEYKHDPESNKNSVEMTLESDASNLEYSVDNGLIWKNLNLNNESPLVVTDLDDKSSLLVRKKGETGENGKLPSLPTAKLNGLFLGDVELDVSQSKIIGGTRDMVYKLSADASSNRITGNDPLIDFKEGNKVWILDAKDEKNKKYLGEVKQSNFADGEEKNIIVILDKKDKENEEDIKGIYYHIGNKEIANQTNIKLQYNITEGQVPKGTWYNLDENSSVNNVNFKPGNVFVRKVEGGNFLPSNPIKLFEIAQPIDPPSIKVNPNNKTIVYESSEDDVYKILDNDFEYKIDNGDYQNGSSFENDQLRFGNIRVAVKKKADQTRLPSKEVSLTLTENISLANVRVNVADQSIEGTTSKMEYRTDGDKKNPTSSWKKASNSTTKLSNMYPGMNIWIREENKPSNERLLLKDLKRMAEPYKGKFEYNVSQKYIQNNDKKILEYRNNNNPWTTIGIGENIGLDIVPRRLSIRTKATRDKLASEIVEVIEELNFPVEAPSVEYDDEVNFIKSIESINHNDTPSDWTAYEFKLSTHIEWMPGENLKGYDLSGNKLVQIRKKGSPGVLPSEIKEVVFTKNIDFDLVKLRKSSPLQLIGTEPEMEYKVYLKGQAIPKTWQKAQAGTSNLNASIKHEDINLIEVRDSRNKENSKVIFGDKSKLPLDLSEVSYEITDTAIKLIGITDRIKYKLSSDDKWVNDHSGDITIQGHNPVEISLEDKLYPEITRTISISERADTPNVIVSKVEYTDSAMTLTLDNFKPYKSQYSFDNGNTWQNSTSNIFPITKDGSLHIRAKAIEGLEATGKLPSEASNNLNTAYLGDVGPSIDRSNKTSLINTTGFMEYSLDSTNGKDGTWKDTSNGQTSVDLKLGSIIWIREKANSNNFRKIEPIEQEEVPDLKNVSYNVSEGVIKNKTSQILEYRVNSGDWIPIKDVNGIPTASNVDFEAGPLEFRQIGDKSKFPSNPKVLTNIKVVASKPKFKYNDIENKITIPDDRDMYEYRITSDGYLSPWKNGPGLDDEDFSGKKTVEIRRKSTETALPSEIQRIDFTNSLLKKVNLSSHVTPYELNGTTANMEYRVWLINDSDTWAFENKWISASQDSSELHGSLVIANTGNRINKIEIRYKDKTEEIVTVYKK